MHDAPLPRKPERALHRARGVAPRPADIRLPRDKAAPIPAISRGCTPRWAGSGARGGGGGGGAALSGRAFPVAVPGRPRSPRAGQVAGDVASERRRGPPTRDRVPAARPPQLLSCWAAAPRRIAAPGVRSHALRPMPLMLPRAAPHRVLRCIGRSCVSGAASHTLQFCDEWGARSAGLAPGVPPAASRAERTLNGCWNHRTPAVLLATWCQMVLNLGTGEVPRRARVQQLLPPYSA